MAKRKGKNKINDKSTMNLNEMHREKEKFMSLVQQQMSQKDFKNADEASAFMQQFTGRTMGHILAEWDTDERTPHDEALDVLGDWQEMMYEEADLLKLRKKAKAALSVCNECLDAWNALALSYRQPKKALEYFQKGIAIGKEKFASLMPSDDEEGCLWGYVEARPLMRLYESFALFFVKENELEAACDIHKLMLLLNKNDNQGVREVLLINLIILGELDAAEEVLAQYPDDTLIGVEMARATITIIKEAYAQSEENCVKLKQFFATDDHKSIFALFPKSKKALQVLNKRNPYLKLFLVDDAVHDLPSPQYLGFRRASEAVEAAQDFQQIWVHAIVPLALIRVYPWKKPTKIDEESNGWIKMLAEASNE